MHLTYDSVDIHNRYDSNRYLPDSAVTGLFALIDNALKIQPEKIVDAGSGTGRFSNRLAAHYGCEVTGIELSDKMRTRAGQNFPEISFLAGSIEEIPLPDQFADLVFMSQVYHHLQNKTAAHQELFRVCREGGLLCVRNSTIEFMDDYLYLRFFPEAIGVNKNYLPAVENIKAGFETAGFRLVKHIPLQQVAAPSPETYFHKIKSRTYSDLLMIADDSFKSGLAGLATYLQTLAPEKPVYDRISVLLFRA